MHCRRADVSEARPLRPGRGRRRKNDPGDTFEVEEIRERTDEEWIAFALERGITCKSRPTNQGYGLYLLTEMIQKNGGSMLIVSGKGLVHVDPKRILAEPLGRDYPRFLGTFLLLDIKGAMTVLDAKHVVGTERGPTKDGERLGTYVVTQRIPLRDLTSDVSRLARPRISCQPKSTLSCMRSTRPGFHWTQRMR